MGGDDPRREQQGSNVIIPDIGAGPYWYVDPSAGVAQQPAQMGQQAQVDHPSIEIMKAVQRMMNPDPAQQEAGYAIRHMSNQPYDPMENERSNQAQLKAWGEQSHRMGPEDVNKTITIDIGKEQWEVPAVFDNMTDEQRNIIQYLPHTQWPKDILMKIEDNARDNLEQGNDPYGNPIKPQRYGF